MRRSSRTKLMTVGIAVVALAVASPTGAAAKKRHHGHHGHKAGGALSVSPPEPFGTADGKPVDRYTLSNGSVTAKIITYGGIIQELWAPDRRGRSANITLGYKDIGGYTMLRGDPPTANPSYFGAIIGRYGNRIGGAKFTLDGQNYTLDANNGPNSLHGGVKGFDKFVWDAESFKDKGVVGLKLTRTSAAGEGCVNPPTACTGYPGNLQVKVVYTLDKARRPADRLQGDDRQGDGRQPHQPRVLEPVGRGHRDDLRPPADAQRQQVHAGRLDADPDRRDAGRGRHAVRLPDPARDRRADPRRQPAADVRPGLRPQLGARPRTASPGSSRPPA